MAPAALIASPGGRAPERGPENVMGAVPETVVSVWLYAAPIGASGRLPLVMENGGMMMGGVLEPPPHAGASSARDDRSRARRSGESTSRCQSFMGASTEKGIAKADQNGMEGARSRNGREMRNAHPRTP